MENMQMRQFDDLSRVTQTVDFAYEEIDSKAFGVDDTPTEFESRVEHVLEFQRIIWDWIYQPKKPNAEGMLLRAIICAWVFIPALRDQTLTQMAGKFGMKKQSLGRWVDDFKKEFPAMAQHLQHIKA